MFETYPKKGKRMLGEQSSVKFAPDGAAPEYQQVGSKTSYPSKGHKGPGSRHQTHEKGRAPFINGRGNRQVSATYPGKTHSNFPSEKAHNTLISPTSRQPKAR